MFVFRFEHLDKSLKGYLNVFDKKNTCIGLVFLNCNN